MHYNAYRTVTAVAAIAIAAFTLAACTTDEPHPTPSSNSTTSVGPQLLGEGRGVTGAVDVPTKLKNDGAKRTAVRLKKCEATKHGWQAVGTVKNSSQSTTSYFITVYFADSHGTVTGWSQTQEDAAPGMSTSWKAGARFTASAATDCTIVAVS